MALDYRKLIEDPDALAAAYAAARKARAREVHRLIIAPVLALFRRPKPLRRTRMIHSQAHC